MPKYPRSKAEKDALYDAIVAGIASDPADFPNAPGDPFDTTAFAALISTKNTDVTDRQTKEADFRVAVDTENDSYDDCDGEARRLIDLAIATLGADSGKLGVIGWGPTAPPQSFAPGQPRVLEATVQQPSGVTLDWKAPAAAASAGKVSFYRVERRVRDLNGTQTEDWGVWQQSSVETEIMLTGLDRGVEYDFRVIAVNANGDSVPSNVVTLVI